MPDGMSGPWEAYQPQATPQASPGPQPPVAQPSVTSAPQAPAGPADGPWSQYAPASSSAQPAQVAPAPAGQAIDPTGYPLVQDDLTTPQPTQTKQQPDGILDRADNVVRTVANAATFGLGKNIDAAEEAIEQPLFHAGADAPTFSERYAQNLANEKARLASVPLSVRVPLDLVGGAAGAAGVGEVAGAVGSIARMIPGANALFDAGSAASQPVVNALSQVPGALPVARAAAGGAAFGAAQGAGDADGGLQNRLAGAATGAEIGAVAGPVFEGAGNLAGRGWNALASKLSEAGYGAKQAIVDAQGQPIIDTNQQPVVATPGVARVAGQQIADTTSDLPATQAALAKTNVLVPGSQPTTFQATGDTGLGQAELALRNTPGSSQAFLDRANQQNAARVGAIENTAPADSSTGDLANTLEQIHAGLQAQQEASTAQAGQGNLQGVGGATESTPTQAGAALRGAIDQARAPEIQAADQAVQDSQQQATNAVDAMGGAAPNGDAGTAAQQFGQQFRAVLDSNHQDARANVTHLANAIDPDGTLAVNMQPAREAGQAIVQSMPQNAAPLAGEEAAIFNTVQGLPDAQSFRELNALNNRVTTAMRAARSDPAQGATYARLSQLRGGLSDIMQNTVEDQAAKDASAVKSGAMNPEAAIIARWKADQQEFYARQATDRMAAGGSIGGSPQGYAGGGSRTVSGDGGAEVSRSGRSGNASGNPSLPSQTPPLVANADQAAVDRINAMRAAHAETKTTFGARAPGVGAVLAPGPTSGTFKLPDSSVGPAIFSKGAGAAERVQAAIKAGLSPADIGKYAAYDLRRFASNPNGTINPAAATRWRQQHAEAFQALSAADPQIGSRFDTAQQMGAQLFHLQAQRAALDATHPLQPGWGDAEVMARVWKPGPGGGDAIKSVTSAAKGSPVAASSIADYAAYSLRKAAAPGGVIDPAKYAAWVRSYDGALSARPDIKAQFDSLAKAQGTLNDAATNHAQALKDFQASAARHFFGDRDQDRAIGRILAGPTSAADMRSLAAMTANDPAAKAGIQRAVVDHIQSRLTGNNLAGQTGTEKLKSDQFQTFLRRSLPALQEVMSAAQIDGLTAVAKDLQRANLSVDGVKAGGGSDTTQKAALLAQGGGAMTLLSLIRSHGMTAALTFAGAHLGSGLGALLGNKAGVALAGMKAAGIKQTSDLVTEAMLNPGLARVLLSNVTAANSHNVASAFAGQIGRIAAARAVDAPPAKQRS